MTQPTQQLPPYLSASTFTFTSQGIVSTGVSTVNVPLTYFGPSIPLGTNWIFGGSTSPASSLITQTTATPSTAFSPLSTLSSTSSSSSSTSSSSSSTSLSTSSSTSTSQLSSTLTSSTSQSSVLSTSSASTSSSSSLPTAQASSHHNNLNRFLPAIIIGSIVGALLIMVLIWLLCRCRRRRSAFAYSASNTSDFVIVDAEGQPRIAGEGEARPTGGEEDSFLSRSADAADAMRERDPSARLVSLSPNDTRTSDSAPVMDTRISAEQTSPKSTIMSTGANRAKSFFAAASASSLFFNPTRGPDPAVIVEDSTPVARDSSSTQPSSGLTYARGPIIPARQLLEMDDEWRREEEAERAAQAAHESQEGANLPYGVQDSPPLRPPPVLNPDAIPIATRQYNSRNSANTQASTVYPDSPTSELEVDENATLLTARRVRMNEGGPGTLLSADTSSSPSSWGSSIGLGLGGLTRLSRLSWFQRMDANRSRAAGNSHSRSRSRPNTPQGRQLTDREILAGRALLGAELGERPLSYVSGHSALSSTGNTLYHDARSSLSSAGSPLRPVTNGGSGPHTPPADMSNIPVPHLPTLPSALSRDENNHVAEDPSDITIDVLDTPAPAAITPFSSTSSRGGPALPPGLEQITTPRTWRDSSSDMPSAASFGTASSGVGGVRMAGPDILEEAPPTAREGWSHLRAMTGGIDSSSTRSTLGQPVIVDNYDRALSERGSLHSMPDALSPLSPVAAGSHSRFSSSNSSGSSRPSIHSRSALSHSNSISSDGRRRRRRDAGEPASPPPGLGRASLSAMGYRGAYSSPPISPMHTGTFASSVTGDTTTTTDVTASSDTTGTTVVDQQTGTVTHLPVAPWTSGH